MSQLIRTSTRERDQAVSRLQTAYAEGRLTSEEFEERMTLMLNSRTNEELDKLLADVSPIARGSSPLPAKASKRAVAFFGGIERRGQWIVPEHYKVTAVFGGCQLDFRDATFSAPVTTIDVFAAMGGVEMIVPHGVRVEVDGSAILGGWSKKLSDEQLPAHAPVIQVKGFAVLGGVDVKYKAPRKVENS